MIGLPFGTRIWLAAGQTDMRRGFDGLASIAQEKLGADPFCGHVFVFRGRRSEQMDDAIAQLELSLEELECVRADPRARPVSAVSDPYT